MSGQPLKHASRALPLAAHGFVLSAHTMVDDEVSGGRLDASLPTQATRAWAAMSEQPTTVVGEHPST